jgi:hypothetical protein
MELCDYITLAGLLADLNQPPRKQSSRRIRQAELPPVYQPPAHKVKVRQCKCGTCDTCVDTARWERIFQQKFADPLYYATRDLPHNSPL